MSEYKFKITYRNEDKYRHYWGDNRYTVSIIAETLEQAKQKLDEIEKNDYDTHKSILAWEAEEITEEKDKEIERLQRLLEIEKNKREQFDEDNYRLHSIIKEVREKVDNFDVFKEFTFPLMKRDEEQQVISSIDYEWRKSVKKPILEILDKEEEEEQYNTYEEQQDYLWENIDEDNVG